MQESSGMKCTTRKRPLLTDVSVSNEQLSTELVSR